MQSDKASGLGKHRFNKSVQSYHVNFIHVGHICKFASEPYFKYPLKESNRRKSTRGGGFLFKADMKEISFMQSIINIKASSNINSVILTRHLSCPIFMCVCTHLYLCLCVCVWGWWMYVCVCMPCCLHLQNGPSHLFIISLLIYSIYVYNVSFFNVVGIYSFTPHINSVHF